jgi:hypothetical protein
MVTMTLDNALNISLLAVFLIYFGLELYKFTRR